MNSEPNAATTARAPAPIAASFTIHDVDHIELWVGNAKQAASYWRQWGFAPVAYSGLETGNRRFASWVMEQKRIRVVLSSPYSGQDEMAAHHLVHGDGVKTISLRVDDVDAAYRSTTARGAVGVAPPREQSDDTGTVRTAAIQGFGQTHFRFVDRGEYGGAFAPTYVRLPVDGHTIPAGLVAVDHIVANVELGKMDHWADWFRNAFGFEQILHFDDDVIHTQYSALMSKVMGAPGGRLRFPINEPARGRGRSQIEEYLDYYGGAGVQHIALLSGDIVQSVRSLRERGHQFLRVPREYYDALPGRIGAIRESYEELAELGILVDRDEDGYLLQTFSQPLQDRPTLFLEVIQRRGARGFGAGNFKALFESIEAEQARRGNL